MDSSEEENSSDEERRKWSIFDEPADLHNPIYFSMYDKVIIIYHNYLGNGYLSI